MNLQLPPFMKQIFLTQFRNKTGSPKILGRELQRLFFASNSLNPKIKRSSPSNNEYQKRLARKQTFGGGL